MDKSKIGNLNVVSGYQFFLFLNTTKLNLNKS